MPSQGPACGSPILTLGPDSRPKRHPSRSLCAPSLSSPAAILLRRCGAPRWPFPSSDLATQAHLKLDRSQDTTRNRFGSWESHLFAVALLKQKPCWSKPVPIDSTMSLSRRFLNLIGGNHVLGFRSLCCIDLTRERFFEPLPAPPATGGGSKSAVAQDTTTQTPAVAAALMMEQFQLPNPILRFETSAERYHWNINCFPFGDRKLLTVDHSGRTLLFDAKARHLVTMPNLHRPKWDPISLFVPNADADTVHGDDGGDGGNLFVMERSPCPEANCYMQTSDQFEAFLYRKPTFPDSCLCQLLPPLPYLRDNKYGRGCHKITAYGVVDGGTQVCISVENVGTYCLDTASHTWSQVGEWTLPFHGNVEYVPEHKLWFGLSADDHKHLAAADLSSMDSQPRLVGCWKELEPHVEWNELQDPQLVNLGSGRFCIARFFHTYDIFNYDFSDESTGESFVVLSSVEVTPSVHDGNCNGSGSGSSNGEAKLEMITHKSLCRLSDATGVHGVF